MIRSEFPLISSPRRLAIVGDFPRSHETSNQRPFAGPNLMYLEKALSRSGMMFANCFAANICRSQPPTGPAAASFFMFDGPDIQEGLAQLRSDLAQFQPNCILLLGELALKAAGIHHTLNSYRGSIFSGFNDKYKCVATFHPTHLFQSYEDMPFFLHDLKRAVAQSEFPELRLPKRKLEINLSPNEIISRLEAILQTKPLVSLDIEGGIPNERAAKVEYKFRNGITCCSISIDPSSAFIIPFELYDDTTLQRVLSTFSRVLADREIPKVLQNGLYDYTALAWHFRCPINNIAHDTMFSGWEIYPELPKGLGTQASIWTEEPYYKSERKVDDQDTHYRYCCKDAAVTLEIHQAHMRAMTPEQRGHYNFNMSIMEPLQYMSLRGFKYDRPASDRRLAELRAQQAELQDICNLHTPSPVNLNSAPQLIKTLYYELGFEKQYKKEGGRKTTTLTADKGALLKLVVSQGARAHPFLVNLLSWKKIEGKAKQLEVYQDSDGRIRCSYNPVGADTGRLSCAQSNTGSGTNLQTISKENRKFYIADKGMYFFQCDLEGADGWTVAAHCAALGDTTMIEDYYAKIKPAKVLALMQLQREGKLPHVDKAINKLSRPEIKALIKSTKLPETLYGVCKVVQHGSNYDMQPARMSENLLEKNFTHSEEFSLMHVPPQECKILQALYFERYPGVRSYQDYVKHQLKTGRALPCASGHVRKFFGRPDDGTTIRAALAHEPQANTTYVTNLAMQRLWQDPENRRSNNSLIIEPVHSVHDALCGQFPIELAEWACKKIAPYFNNRIQVAKENIVIPYDGGYGQSWYHTDEDNRIGEI